MLSLYPVFATLHRMLEGSGDNFMVDIHCVYGLHKNN